MVFNPSLRFVSAFCAFCEGWDSCLSDLSHPSAGVVGVSHNAFCIPITPAGRDEMESGAFGVCVWFCFDLGRGEEELTAAIDTRNRLDY
jgi:hypothetical protein